MKEMSLWKHGIYILLNGDDVTQHVKSVGVEECVGDGDSTDTATVVFQDDERRYLKTVGNSIKGAGIQVKTDRGAIVFTGHVDLVSYSGSRGNYEMTLKCLVFANEDTLNFPFPQPITIEKANVTIEALVREVCEEHTSSGFDFEIEETGITLPTYHYVLHNESHWKFLNTLAELATSLSGDGKIYEVLIKPNPASGTKTIIFRSRNDSAGASVSIGEDGIISYAIDEVEEKAKKVKTDVYDIDGKSEAVQEAMELYMTTSDGKAAADAARYHRELKEAKSVKYREALRADERMFVRPHMTFEEFYKTYMTEKHEGPNPRVKLTVLGSLKLAAGLQVSVSGIGMYSGVYYIREASHNWTRNKTYTTDVLLSKNLSEPTELNDDLGDIGEDREEPGFWKKVLGMFDIE